MLVFLHRDSVIAPVNWTFWGVCVVRFFAMSMLFVNLSWLPGYLVKERGYTVMDSGTYLVLPYLVAGGAFKTT